MVVIKCKDQNFYSFKLKKFGRVKRIFWDQRGHAYYRRGNKRTYLNTVERLIYPYSFEDEFGKYQHIFGCEYIIGAHSPVYIEILDDGESVQLWEEA